MNITWIHGRELDAGLCRRWRELQAGNRNLASPYFSVEFTQAVAVVRDDVFVGLVEDDGCIQAFFPFQRKSATIAGPVGAPLSDCQGLIAAEEFACDSEHLLRACELRIWDFDHLIAAQRAFARFATARSESPIIDLSSGFDAYLSQRRAAGSHRIAQLQRKMRKFEREIGELRFEVESRDDRAFAQVIEWKSEQCRRTGVPDFMAWGWTTALLEQIWLQDKAEFAGMLSVLRHGDDILAAHFGMRSADVCHWWFPTYSDAYGKHSPGGILLLKLAEAMAASGVRHIDLGKGEDSYKPAFATGAVPLIEGSVMVPSLTATLRRTRCSVDSFLRGSPLLHPARAVLRRVRNLLR